MIALLFVLALGLPVPEESETDRPVPTHLAALWRSL